MHFPVLGFQCIFVVVVYSYIRAFNKVKTILRAKYPLICIDKINSITKQCSLVIGWVFDVTWFPYV